MLNYLSAELWGMTRRRTVCIGWGIYLLLVILVSLTIRGNTPWECLIVFQNFMVVGLYVAFPLAGWAGGGLDRAGGLVNEVAFGLPRTRIYLGKLAAALLVGMALFLLTTVAFFLGALTPEAVLEMAGEDRQLVGAGLLLAMCNSLPRYVGAVSLSYFLAFSLRPSGVGTVLYYLYITVGELTLAAVRVMGMGAVGNVINHLAETVRPFLLSNTYFSYGIVSASSALEDGSWPLGNSWLTGALWLGLTTGLGLLLFRRREIR